MPAKLLFALILTCLSAIGTAVRAEGIFRLGVPLVQDQTGEVFRDAYGANLRRFLVAELIERGQQPIFLNTGPTLDYVDDELVRDLAVDAKVDAVVTVSMAAIVDGKSWKRIEKSLPTGAMGGEEAAATQIRSGRVRQSEIRKLVAEGGAVLVAEASLAPIADLSARRIFFIGAEIRKSFFRELADFNVPGSAGQSFRDSAPGRAALKAAEQIATRLLVLLVDSHFKPTGVAPRPGGVCQVTFGIRFSREKRGSRNYTLAVNGKEETHALRNGRVTLDVPGGLFQVRVTIQDPPYGLTTQAAYDANRFIECPDNPKSAVLEIGGAGEAELKWEDP